MMMFGLIYAFVSMLFLVYVVVGFIWSLAEFRIYGEKQTRLIDTVVAAVLSISITCNIMQLIFGG